MKRLTSNILPGGRFCGHITGERDSWTQIPTMNYATKEEIKSYFKGFTFELFEEKEYDGSYFSGQKHWHYYKIVAKKN
jgi:hypothetical protein